jgi:hypothetical protein
MLWRLGTLSRPQGTFVEEGPNRLSDLRRRKGLLDKVPTGLRFSASGAYPEIRMTFISGCTRDNSAAISVPLILPGIPTSESKRSIVPRCCLAIVSASVASFASSKTMSPDPLSVTRMSLGTISSSSTIRWQWSNVSDTNQPRAATSLDV